MEDYKEGDTIYILMKADMAQAMMDGWLLGNYQCDLHVCRSKKTKGCVVVKTKDIMWANRIIKWHGYEKVTYRREAP